MKTRRALVGSALAVLVVGALGIGAAAPAVASSVFTVEWTVIGIYPRTGPSMDDPRDGAALSDGTSITVVCEAPGAPVTSNVVSNDTIWEQLDNGSWLPNAFVNTGYNGWTPGMPRCDVAPAPSNPAPSNPAPSNPAPTTPTYTALANSNLRSGPGTNYPVVGTVAKGTVLSLSCYLDGEVAGGTAIWDRLSSGAFISDSLVLTGSNNPVVPVCGSTPAPPSTSTAPAPAPSNPAPAPASQSGSGGTPSSGGSTPATPALRASSQFNRAAAAAWIEAHWNDAPHMTIAPLGIVLFQVKDDCTWFASSVLWAGGLKPTSDWEPVSWDPNAQASSNPLYYPGPTKDAMDAADLESYLRGQPGLVQVIPIADLNDPSVPGAQVGDLIFYVWNPNIAGDSHMAVVSASGAAYTKVAQHTPNYEYKTWNIVDNTSQTVLQQNPNMQAYLIHITY